MEKKKIVNKRFSLVGTKEKKRFIIEDYNNAESALYAFLVAKTRGQHLPQNGSGELVDLPKHEDLTVEVDVEFEDGSKTIGENILNHISYLS